LPPAGRSCTVGHAIQGVERLRERERGEAIVDASAYGGGGPDKTTAKNLWASVICFLFLPVTQTSIALDYIIKLYG
jgi:hypothetical protein